MLKGIPSILSPELLKVLSEMGHGDEIVLADANFPSETIASGTAYGRAVRADGIGAVELLNAILPFFPLDQYDPTHFILMELVPGDPCKTPIWEAYASEAARFSEGTKIVHLERFAFYERAKTAYAIVATGEKAQYANIILKKGVVI